MCRGRKGRDDGIRSRAEQSSAAQRKKSALVLPRLCTQLAKGKDRLSLLVATRGYLQLSRKQRRQTADVDEAVYLRTFAYEICSIADQTEISQTKRASKRLVGMNES